MEFSDENVCQVKSSQVKSSQLKSNKILVGLALVMGIPFFGVAHAEYVTDKNSNCKVWSQVNGHSVTITKYVGQCSATGYATGQGELYWNFGRGKGSYKGELSEGKLNGAGIAHYSDGNTGIGIWQNGDLTQKTNSVNEAELEQKAKAEWTLTETYQCKVRNIYSNHTAKWSGGCQDGYVEGMGTLEWYKDDKLTGTYVGSFSQGNMQGKGVYTWANGTKYDGEWKDDKRHGKGIHTWANGSKYDGEQKDGKRHGLGKLTLVKGDNAIADYGNGEWQGDVFIAQGEFVNGKHTLQCEPNQKACDKARAEQKKQEQERREREYKASVEACKSRYVGERIRLKAPYTVSSFIFFSSTEYEYLPFKVVGVGKDKMTVEAVYDGGIIGDISSANIPCNATSVR